MTEKRDIIASYIIYCRQSGEREAFLNTGNYGATLLHAKNDQGQSFCQLYEWLNQIDIDRE